jgi:hypothetical protein
MRYLSAALPALLLLAPLAAAGPPEQVHLSWLDGRIGVTWARPEADGDPAAYDTIQWSVGNATLEQSANALTSVLLAPGTWIATGEITPPAAAQTLRYRVGSDAKGWSPERNVSLGARNGTWTFVAYGDHGSESEQSKALVPLVAAQRPNAVLHAGDLSYANGKPPLWDQWFRLIEPLASTTFYMAAPGNHEHEGNWVASGPSTDYATYARPNMHPYEMFIERFHYPAHGLHYSFDLGPVHVTVFNTEDICLQSIVQFHVPWRVNPACAADQANQTLIDWVRNDLAAHQDAPWRFVLIHRPVQSSGSYTGEEVLRQRFVPLFEQYKVHLVISGHDHNLQVSYPLRAGVPETSERTNYTKGQAPIYIITGGAGEGVYSLKDPAPAWAAYRAREFHYTRIEVNATGLRADFISIPDSALLHTFTIGDNLTRAVQDPPASEPAKTPWPALAATMAALAFALGLRVRRTRTSDHATP